MSTKPIDIIVSIGLGLISIYAAHSFLVVDACLDMGGAFDEKTRVCLDSNYHEIHMVFSGALLSIYFVIGLIVSLMSAFIITKIRASKGG